MTSIFENVGIIGLGLIGGSLARSIKKNGIAQNITGYTKTTSDLHKALELGIIDKIASSNTEIAKNCDIIIICTPLSAYEDIFKEISPIILEKDCIISDVGSLKLPVINLADKYLAAKNLKNFIPAHPIAGTEKTGIESGFAELFENKKVILTPNINNNQYSIDIISNLWKKCGSDVQIIDAALHDKIYAEVSHLPQFLAYCYAMLLLKNSQYINYDLKNNSNFWQFSRICASEPKIWYDIFSLNIANLEDSLRNFTVKIKDVILNNESSKLNIDDNILTTVIPAIISNSLVNCSSHAQYGGTGFKDLTLFLNNSYQQTDKSKKLTEEFLLYTQELIALIKANDYKNAMEFMQNAASSYANFKKEIFG